MTFGYIIARVLAEELVVAVPHIIALRPQIVCIEQWVGECALDMSDLGLKDGCRGPEIAQALGKVS